MRMLSKPWWMIFALLPALPALAQTLKEEASLLDKPDGSKVAAGKAGTAIKIKRRQGFWVEVDMGGKSGWVQLGKLSMSGGAGGAVAIDTGRSGTGNIVSASSARGLSAKDLLNGKPDRQAVAKLDSFMTEAGATGRFRSDGGIMVLTDKVALSAPSAAPRAPANGAKSDDDFDAPKKTKRAGDDW